MSSAAVLAMLLGIAVSVCVFLVSVVAYGEAVTLAACVRRLGFWTKF